MAASSSSLASTLSATISPRRARCRRAGARLHASRCAGSGRRTRSRPCLRPGFQRRLERLGGRKPADFDRLTHARLFRPGWARCQRGRGRQLNAATNGPVRIGPWNAHRARRIEGRICKPQRRRNPLRSGGPNALGSITKRHAPATRRNCGRKSEDLRHKTVRVLLERGRNVKPSGRSGRPSLTWA